MYKYIVIISLLLVGCSSTPVYIPEPEDKVHVPQHLLQECGDLPLLVGSTYNDVIYHYLDTISAYGVCKDRQKASITTIKELSGNE